MAKRQVFPFCCSLYILSNLYGSEVDEIDEQCKNTGVPIIFTDSLMEGNGKRIAAGLRKKGYRVDEIKDWVGAHGTKVRMWMWYNNKNSAEGKLPSRMLKDEQKNKVRSGKPGTVARARAARPGI